MKMSTRLEEAFSDLERVQYTLHLLSAIHYTDEFVETQDFQKALCIFYKASEELDTIVQLMRSEFYDD